MDCHKFPAGACDIQDLRKRLPNRFIPFSRTSFEPMTPSLSTEQTPVSSEATSDKSLRGCSHLYAAGGATDDRQDQIRRFVPLPHAADLLLMQRTIRLETNDVSLLNLALKFFERYQHGGSSKPQFLWRLRCESDARAQSTAVPFSAFCGASLRYVNIGQRGFLAVDLANRMGAGVFSDAFVRADARLRHRPPLDILFCMTAASLGLTALSGGCVGSSSRAAMIFGPPNSGKTTSCYLAARAGLEFHGDQVVFLDMQEGRLSGWGDPFPAVFRPQAVNFIPELLESSHPSDYDDLSFYYFDKSALQSQFAMPIEPLCSVFLDRVSSGKPRLDRISSEQAAAKLRENVLFEEDAEFDVQIMSSIGALSLKPAYNLTYANDPNVAAEIIGKMLR